MVSFSNLFAGSFHDAVFRFHFACDESPLVWVLFNELFDDIIFFLRPKSSFVLTLSLLRAALLFLRIRSFTGLAIVDNL